LTLDPGWKKFESEIRDKHPGSASLMAQEQISPPPSQPDLLYSSKKSDLRAKDVYNRAAAVTAEIERRRNIAKNLEKNAYNIKSHYAPLHPSLFTSPPPQSVLTSGGFSTSVADPDPNRMRMF
jgi:hypothetical protein